MHRIDYLIETVAPASSNSFLSFSASAFGQAFLDLARHAFDQILGFLQAQAGRLANDLDHADLLVAEAFEHDVEFGLFRRRFGSAAASRRHGHHYGAAGRRLDAVDVLQDNRSIPWPPSA